MVNFKFLKKLNSSQIALLTLAIVICFLSLWFVSLRVGKPIVRSICIAAMSTERPIDREQRVRVIEAQTVNLGTVSKRINTVGHLHANAMVVVKSEI